MVTIKDIAKESGYSVSTVSRVLNNRRDVSPVAKQRIEEIVAKYNFVPNNNAKSLKQTVSETIVILVKGTANMLFADIVEEIQRMLEKTKYTSVVAYIDETDNEVQQAIQICWERKPLGLLFLGGNPENFKQQFADVEVPSVLVTNSGESLGFENLASVCTDDIAAAECAIDYLIENGHQEIGIIGGSLEKSHTSRMRHEGCMKSFEKNNLHYEEDKAYASARFSFEGAYQAMNELLDKNKILTAVFAMSDVMAVGAIRALKDRSLCVPEDISVIGFDGVALAEYYNPKLATIKQQYKQLANRSVKILFNLLELGMPAVHEVIPFELAKGESVHKI